MLQIPQKCLYTSWRILYKCTVPMLCPSIGNVLATPLLISPSEWSLYCLLVTLEVCQPIYAVVYKAASTVNDVEVTNEGRHYFLILYYFTSVQWILESSPSLLTGVQCQWGDSKGSCLPPGPAFHSCPKIFRYSRGGAPVSWTTVGSCWTR